MERRPEVVQPMTPEEKEQFIALLDPLLAKLSRFALALMRDSEDARDLVSDTILLAFEHFRSVREPQAFTSYLFTIASRLYLSRKRRKSIWMPWSGMSDTLAYDPRSKFDASLDRTALEVALTRLPVKQREAVILFEISELSLEEVRKIQGGSLSGVKSRIARGRKQLARLLGEPSRETHRTKVKREADAEAAEIVSLHYSLMDRP